MSTCISMHALAYIIVFVLYVRMYAHVCMRVKVISESALTRIYFTSCHM